MVLPRELVYEEKKKIQQFGVNDEKTLNHLIYEKWLLTRTDLQPLETGLSKRRLNVFNDAYYICTLILMHPTSEGFASYAVERCSLPSVVLPMVYLYISKVGDCRYSNSRLLEDIKTGLKSKGWEGNLNELINSTSTFTGTILSSEFEQRELTSDLLSRSMWYKITGGYKREDIWKIVRYIAKNEKEWVMVLDAIRNGASEYEWDYNNNLQDYFDDESGQWVADTPIDLSPTYQYIDELKEKYEKESIHEERILTQTVDACTVSLVNNGDNFVLNESTEIAPKGRPKAKPFESFLKRDTPKCFMEILDDMLKGKKGQGAALIISACIDYWIITPTIQSVVNSFPSVKYSAFNEAMKKNTLFTNEQKEEIRKEIRSKIEEMSSNRP